jgi:hypothetical protein
LRSPQVILLAVLGAVMSLAGCTHRRDVQHTLRSQNFQAPDAWPELLAAYQPWFGRPGHIDVGYNSQDRVVLQRQIQEARNLGIHGFVVNWYGPRHAFEDHAYMDLQQEAAQRDFRVALMYDEDTDDPGHSTEQTISDLQYAFDHYIGPEADSSRTAYLRYDGRPVIFLFPKGGGTDWARVRQSVSQWPDPPLLLMKDIRPDQVATFDGFYAWVQPGAGGWANDGSNWGHDYLDNFYARMSAKYPDKLAIGAAWPGFNDARASWSRNRRIDPRCGRTFEESLRLFRRYFSAQHPLPFLLIETWNDYEEGTAIERGGYTQCGSNSATATASTGPQTSQ